MADESKPETAPVVAPQTSEAAAAATGSKAAPAAGQTASAPATGANAAATPHMTTSAAARPAAAPRPPAAPLPDLGGKTTNIASPGGAAAARAAIPAAKPAVAAAGRDADDTSPLLSRRAWMGLAWGAFSAASAAALAATGRFMFPNVLNEPPQQFKAGFPNEYGVGVDERWKEKFGIWIVRIADENVEPHGSGFYALITVCTHLGCTPNYLSAENKFKCPCHGSGYRLTGINFEGPAPRPLERARIVLADDGQILVDKSKHYQYELGQWTDPEAFLKA
ncbi:MAG TPA: ubiquinol-cytochrome c reductase iron-sulfur subunit [Vicinamibacterales bacterium]|jgi:cytochrome b6-f complex iron-sulfur subunit|nr:ubiquinol-cytochrome c reductase iron-sulfur subunit [Vicinamibacterales bacterium]